MLDFEMKNKIFIDYTKVQNPSHFENWKNIGSRQRVEPVIRKFVLVWAMRQFYTIF